MLADSISASLNRQEENRDPALLCRWPCQYLTWRAGYRSNVSEAAVHWGSKPHPEPVLSLLRCVFFSSSTTHTRKETNVVRLTVRRESAQTATWICWSSRRHLFRVLHSSFFNPTREELATPHLQKDPRPVGILGSHSLAKLPILVLHARSYELPATTARSNHVHAKCQRLQ